MLAVSCDEYGALAGGGAVDYDKLLSITAQHLEREVLPAVEQLEMQLRRRQGGRARPAERPLGHPAPEAWAGALTGSTLIQMAGWRRPLEVRASDLEVPACDLGVDDAALRRHFACNGLGL